MGKSKSKKQKANLDEPGPDDFTYLAIFFPVGRNGAAMAKDNDLEDQAAAQRIGMWMHHAGLPIRKLFSRKSEEHILVEVRQEVPQDVIDSKLGAYKWGDMLYAVRERDAASESTIMRAKVKSHDAIEKMGGMVYFPISKIVPNAPKAQSPFKEIFPPPRRHSLTEPSTFSAIKYLPLPMVHREEDIKPTIHAEVEEEKPDIKPDVTPNIRHEIPQDTKPVIVKDESKPSLPIIENRIQYPIDMEEFKPHLVKPEDDREPLHYPAEIDEIKPKVEAKLEIEDTRPVVDMNITDDIAIKVETKPKIEKLELPPDMDDPDFKPKVEANNTEAKYVHPVPDMKFNPDIDEDQKPLTGQSNSSSHHTAESRNPSTVKAENGEELGPDTLSRPEGAIHRSAGAKRLAGEQPEREIGVKRERREI